jgi:hypothetical protein
VHMPAGLNAHGQMYSACADEVNTEARNHSMVTGFCVLGAHRSGRASEPYQRRCSLTDYPRASPPFTPERLLFVRHTVFHSC